MEDLAKILCYEHLAMMGGIGVLMELLKGTLNKAKVNWKGSPVWHMLMPYLPVIFGGACAFIPGMIQPEAMALGPKIFLGCVMGGSSGQGFKIIKSKVEVAQGKVQ